MSEVEVCCGQDTCLAHCKSLSSTEIMYYPQENYWGEGCPCTRAYGGGCAAEQMNTSTLNLERLKDAAHEGELGNESPWGDRDL